MEEVYKEERCSDHPVSYDASYTWEIKRLERKIEKKQRAESIIKDHSFEKTIKFIGYLNADEHYLGFLQGIEVSEITGLMAKEFKKNIDQNYIECIMKSICLQVSQSENEIDFVNGEEQCLFLVHDESDQNYSSLIMVLTKYGEESLCYETISCIDIKQLVVETSSVELLCYFGHVFHELPYFDIKQALTSRCLQVIASENKKESLLKKLICCLDDFVIENLNPHKAISLFGNIFEGYFSKILSFHKNSTIIAFLKLFLIYSEKRISILSEQDIIFEEIINQNIFQAIKKLLLSEELISQESRLQSLALIEIIFKMTELFHKNIKFYEHLEENSITSLCVDLFNNGAYIEKAQLVPVFDFLVQNFSNSCLKEKFSDPFFIDNLIELSDRQEQSTKIEMLNLLGKMLQFIENPDSREKLREAFDEELIPIFDEE